jgi:hypothetical protein
MFFYFCTTGYNACTCPSEDPCTEPFGRDGCIRVVKQYNPNRASVIKCFHANPDLGAKTTKLNFRNKTKPSVNIN